MATQEVNKPQSLPPYPEIILRAIEVLNEPNGSNKSAISNYMESIYGEELPEDHSTVLSNHLNQMKENGEVVFVKNNYLKPDPSAPAPPKRGRGRPPKPKDPLAPPPPAAVFSPPRPRGRPPKNPNAPPKAPKASSGSGSGRGRGRPKKVARTTEASAPSNASVAVPATAENVDADVPTVAVPNASGRPRGRPPKVKTQLTEVSVES